MCLFGKLFIQPMNKKFKRNWFSTISYESVKDYLSKWLTGNYIHILQSNTQLSKFKKSKQTLWIKQHFFSNLKLKTYWSTKKISALFDFF